MRICASIACLVLVGCGPFIGPPVHFVLPDGYRGAFYLIHDPTKGVTITKRDGRFTLTIPEGGRLRVRDFAFVQRWHQETAAFVTGVPIGTSDDFATNAISLWSGSKMRINHDPEFIWYVVGTQRDLNAVSRDSLRP
jgi:hypothetical protein